MRTLRLGVLLFSGLISGNVAPSPEPAPTHKTPIVPRSHVLLERHEPGHTKAWEKKSRALADTVLPVRIGLAQSNLEHGRKKLWEISDPSSASYGKHLSSEEVMNLFAPHEDSVATVTKWLASAGVTEDRISRSMNKQWIQFDAPVKEVEDLLYADFHLYEHKVTRTTNIACSGYHVPENIRRHIDYITPGIRLMPEEGIQRSRIKRRNRKSAKERSVESDLIVKPLSHAAKAADGDQQQPAARTKYRDLVEPDSDCQYDTIPDCIRAQYGIPKGTKKDPRNKMGIFQGLNIWYWQGDLDRYFSVAAPEIPEGTRPVDRLANGAQGETDDPAESGEEAVMDFQLAMALIWPQETVLWHVDDPWYEAQHRASPLVYKGYFNNLFNAMDGSYCNSSAYGYTGNCEDADCLDPSYPNTHSDEGYKGELMCGEFEPTNVLSISFSGSEASLPAAYQKRQCDEIMKLALQGVTVVASSGDQGVGSHKRDPPPIGCLGEDSEVFNPSFLNNCPYVLSTGGTMWNRERRVDELEPDVPEEEGNDGKGKGEGKGKGKSKGKGEGKGKGKEAGKGKEKPTPDPDSDPVDGWRVPGQEDPNPLHTAPAEEKGGKGKGKEAPPPQTPPQPATSISSQARGSSSATSSSKTRTASKSTELPSSPTTHHIAPSHRRQKRQRGGRQSLRQPPYTERAAVDFDSGGGFSNIYPVPDYQANHTAAYFAALSASAIDLGFEGYEGGRTDYKTIGQDGKLFNLQGRGYPDLSAIGDNIYVVHAGEAVGIMGTSAATPIVASMVNLINEERLAVGKGPVGWIHPILYSHPEVFYDVTVGGNPGCRSDGFRATKGWDPVTGLGTPNFPKMLELFMSLP